MMHILRFLSAITLMITSIQKLIKEILLKREAERLKKLEIAFEEAAKVAQESKDTSAIDALFEGKEP